MTTATLTLAAFLEARLAEDEAVARSASAALHDWDCWSAVSSDAIALRKYEVGSFIARHDPARALSEVAAKRAIVEAHSDERAYLGCFHDPQGDDLEMGEYNSWHDDHDCPTLRALASVYKDHPEWREEWS